MNLEGVSVELRNAPRCKSDACKSFGHHQNDRIFIKKTIILDEPKILIITHNLHFSDLHWTPGATRMLLFQLHKLGQKKKVSDDRFNPFYELVVSSLFYGLVKRSNLIKIRSFIYKVRGKESPNKNLWSFTILNEIGISSRWVATQFTFNYNFHWFSLSSSIFCFHSHRRSSNKCTSRRVSYGGQRLPGLKVHVDISMGEQEGPGFALSSLETTLKNWRNPVSPRVPQHPGNL